VLLLIRYFEIAENNQEYKEIVHAEREFDHITSDEIQSNGPSLPEENENREQAARAIQKMDNATASRKPTRWDRRFSTPKSRPSIASTKRLKRIQKAALRNLTT